MISVIYADGSADAAKRIKGTIVYMYTYIAPEERSIIWRVYQRWQLTIIARTWPRTVRDKSRCNVEFIIMTRERLYTIYLMRVYVRARYDTRERANYRARSARRQSAACMEYREPITINCAHHGARHFARDFAINKNQPQLIGEICTCGDLGRVAKKERQRERGGRKSRHFLRTLIFRVHPVITRRVIMYALLPNSARMRFFLARPLLCLFFTFPFFVKTRLVHTDWKRIGRLILEKQRLLRGVSSDLRKFKFPFTSHLQTRHCAFRRRLRRNKERERIGGPWRDFISWFIRIFDVEYDFLSLLSLKMEDGLIWNVIFYEETFCILLLFETSKYIFQTIFFN